MNLNAPNVDYVIAAYAVAFTILAGVVIAILRAYKKAKNET